LQFTYINFTAQFPDQFPWRPRGVNLWDSSIKDGFFVGDSGLEAVSPGPFLTINLFRVQNVGKREEKVIVTPHLISVPVYYDPFFVPQKNSPLLISTNFECALNHPYAFPIACKNKETKTKTISLWLSHHIAINQQGVSVPFFDQTAAASRWYEIHIDINSCTSDIQPHIFQMGTVFDPRPAAVANSYIFPSIIPTFQLTSAVMGFTITGSQLFPSAGYTERLSSTPLGEMKKPKIYKKGTGPFNLSADNFEVRWGDYSQTTLDPVDLETIWTIQEWSKLAQDLADLPVFAPSEWAVQVLSLKPCEKKEHTITHLLSTFCSDFCHFYK